jgi:dienelactone hydrolase
MGVRRYWRIAASIVCGAAACAESTGGDPSQSRPMDAAVEQTPGTHVRFEPGQQGAALDFGAIPWPDDLYLNQQSKLSLGALPAGTVNSDYMRKLRESLPELDGFGVTTPIYFYVDGGSLDENTLPQTAEESVGSRASVFLIDADSASPEAFQRLRVDIRWSEQLHRLALRPALGHPLTPGRRYAAIVTRRVKDRNGKPLAPELKFAAVRDNANVTDARLLRARAEYTPVFETLVKALTPAQTPREDIVSMAVFRVQSANADLEAARRKVRALDLPAPSGLVMTEGTLLDSVLGKADSPSAAPHDQLSAMIHGNLPSANFLSATAKVHGVWTRDETGMLSQKRTEDVPFTLFLPRGSEPAPVVIYQHQRGHERSDAALIANVLASRNIALIAIDAPFQGLRAKSDAATQSVDTRNRFTGSNIPDRFGDQPGDFYGADDTQALLVPFHPFYVRDALRQGVVDLMTLVRFLDEGDLSVFAELGTAGARKLDTRRIGFIGEDLGAAMGVLLAPFEPKVQALALVGAGAFVAQGFWLDATHKELFSRLAELVGRSAENVDYERDSPAYWPELALFETLLGRGEPAAYASTLRRTPVNVLLLMAQDDEVVANVATEALAVSLGANLLSAEARYLGDLDTYPASSGDPVTGNFQIENDHVTRLLRIYDPADHSLLLSAAGQHTYATPVRPPFHALAETTSFDNPVSDAQSTLADYFDSFFKCVSTVNSTASPIKCGATTNAP